MMKMPKITHKIAYAMNRAKFCMSTANINRKYVLMKNITKVGRDFEVLLKFFMGIHEPITKPRITDSYPHLV